MNWIERALLFRAATGRGGFRDESRRRGCGCGCLPLLVLVVVALIVLAQSGTG